jgi:hypothetical protein
LFQITAAQANGPQKKKKIHRRERALANSRREYITSGTEQDRIISFLEPEEQGSKKTQEPKSEK